MVPSVSMMQHEWREFERVSQICTWSVRCMPYFYEMADSDGEVMTKWVRMLGELLLERE